MELINSDGSRAIKSKVKSYVLSSGANILTEFEYRPSMNGQGEELFWINPMAVMIQQLPTGQLGINLSPLITLTKEEVAGPINENSILFSHDVSIGLEESYKGEILKLKARKAGLVQASSMPKNIGGNMNIGGK